MLPEVWRRLQRGVLMDVFEEEISTTRAVLMTVRRALTLHRELLRQAFERTDVAGETLAGKHGEEWDELAAGVTDSGTELMYRRAFLLHCNQLEELTRLLDALPGVH